MKKISDIANEFTMKRFKTASQQDGHSDKEYCDLLGDAIYDYVNQQIELAVDKALEIVSGDVAGKFCYDGGSMCLLDARSESILSLRTQILNEIKDR